MQIEVRGRRNASIAAWYLIVAFTLVAGTFLLHGNALNAYWRFDDGWLLDFATRFSFSDYFFNPLITRAYSPSNVTPWNPLVYDFNLALFGFQAQWFYAHHLLAIAVSALATYALLTCFVKPVGALLGSILFLMGAPVFLVAQQLMVGHYVYGLIFCSMALFCFVRGVRGESYWWTIFGVFSFALASSCKEVFVPLVVVLVFVPVGNARSRLIHAIPYFAWSIFYAGWRYKVLGAMLGGYQQAKFDPWVAAQQLLQIPSWLMGGGSAGWLISSILLVLLYDAVRRHRVRILVVFVSLVALITPLIALTAYPGLHGPNRHLLLPWWAVVVLITILVARCSSWPVAVRFSIVGIFAIATLRHGLDEREAIEPGLVRLDAIYREAIDARPNTVLVLPGQTLRFWEVVLNGARRAKAAAEHRPFARVNLLTDPKLLPLVDPDTYQVRMYNASCACMEHFHGPSSSEKIGNRAPERSLDYLVFRLTPYPPLVDSGGGRVESIRVTGDKVSLSGWLNVSRKDPEQILVLTTPYRPLRHQLDAVARPDIAGTRQAEDMLHTGFRLQLSYADAEAAVRAANSACLMVISSLKGIRSLENPINEVCSGLAKGGAI